MVQPTGQAYTCEVSSPFPPHTRRLLLAAVQATDPILLQGETGSGKTHLARWIHESGPRQAKPIVVVNCAAIPAELFERELFGHARGAFTGADGGAPGLFEASEGGTLVLDEVADLPLRLQPKLLQLLDDGTLRRLGAVDSRKVNVRVIASTNQDVKKLLRRGRFRKDLYYRLSVFEFVVSPLRHRKEEIPGLTDQFLRDHRCAMAVDLRFSDEAMEALLAHAWPGNIRELRNAIRRTSLLARNGVIALRDLPREVRQAQQPRANPTSAVEKTRYVTPDSPVKEKAVIAEALAAEEQNRTRAARRLGMSRSTLWMKMQIHGFNRPS